MAARFPKTPVARDNRTFAVYYCWRLKMRCCEQTETTFSDAIVARVFHMWDGGRIGCLEFKHVGASFEDIVHEVTMPACEELMQQAVCNEG